jgi:DNA-binding protein HU-beta
LKNPHIERPSRVEAAITCGSAYGEACVNKSDLIKSIADEHGLKLTEATRLVDAVFDTITDNLRRGEQVAISGFGTFMTKSRAARDGRNPASGATIKIPARTSMAFKPAQAMKDLK